VIKFRCPHCTQKIAANDEGADAAISCPTCARPIFVPLESSPEFRPERAPVPVPVAATHLVPAAEVDDARAALLPHLARLLMDKLVQALLFQRRRMLAAQQTGTTQLAALEQRLTQLQTAYEVRLGAYEQRITELEGLLERREEENRGLVHRQLELTVQALEAELARTEADTEESLHDAGVVLGA